MPTRADELIGYGPETPAWTFAPDNGVGRDGSTTRAPPASAKDCARATTSLAAAPSEATVGATGSVFGTAHWPSASMTETAPSAPAGLVLSTV